MTRKRNVRLKTAIWKSGMSQRDLAKKVGLHESVISMAINGRYILEETQKELIAKALGRNVDQLF